MKFHIYKVNRVWIVRLGTKTWAELTFKDALIRMNIEMLVLTEELMWS